MRSATELFTDIANVDERTYQNRRIRCLARKMVRLMGKAERTSRQTAHTTSRLRAALFANGVFATSYVPLDLP
jgi:hypothetical protein